MDRWFGGEPAWDSPPLLAGIRRRSAAPSRGGAGVRQKGAMTATGLRPVVFAYDGSDLAKAAIDEAGRQLMEGRDALVRTVWQTFNVGFLPVGAIDIDAAQTEEVRKAAEQTAAEG